MFLVGAQDPGPRGGWGRGSDDRFGGSCLQIGCSAETSSAPGFVQREAMATLGRRPLAWLRAPRDGHAVLWSRAHGGMASIGHVVTSQDVSTGFRRAILSACTRRDSGLGGLESMRPRACCVGSLGGVRLGGYPVGAPKAVTDDARVPRAWCCFALLQRGDVCRPPGSGSA